VIRGQLQLVVDRFVTPLLDAGLAAPGLDLVGEIPLDPSVRESVKRRQLLLEILPGSAAAQAIEAIATRLEP
jgi:flagellar biosynthesis protein FlhG